VLEGLECLGKSVIAQFERYQAAVHNKCKVTDYDRR
jgi:hypothetical protein